MSKRVIVVTNTELGGDCVVGVFANEEAIVNSFLNEDEEYSSYKEMETDLRDICYVFHTQTIMEG